MVAAESDKTGTVVAAKRPRPAPTQPNTLDMVVEAITSINERKGASVPAIKSYIVNKYASDPNMLKYRLKKAIVKGMEQDILSRPKGMEDAGTSLNGRFRLNKAKIAAMEKAKQPKSKAKPKAKVDKPKVKKPKAEKVEKIQKKAAKSKENKTGMGVKKTKDVKTKKPKATAAKSPGKKAKAEKSKKTEKAKKPKNKTTDKKVPKTPKKSAKKAK